MPDVECTCHETIYVHRKRNHEYLKLESDKERRSQKALSKSHFHFGRKRVKTFLYKRLTEIICREMMKDEKNNDILTAPDDPPIEASKELASNRDNCALLLMGKPTCSVSVNLLKISERKVIETLKSDSGGVSYY